MSKAKIIGAGVLGTAAIIGGASTSAFASTMPKAQTETQSTHTNNQDNTSANGKVNTVKTSSLQSVKAPAQRKSSATDASKSSNSSDVITTTYIIQNVNGDVISTNTYTNKVSDGITPPPAISSKYKIMGYMINGNKVNQPSMIKNYTNGTKNDFTILVAPNTTTQSSKDSSSVKPANTKDSSTDNSSNKDVKAPANTDGSKTPVNTDGSKAPVKTDNSGVKKDNNSNTDSNKKSDTSNTPKETSNVATAVEQSNGTVVFTLNNQTAKDVSLKTSFDNFGKSLTMKKNDSGLWTVTVNFNNKLATGNLNFEFLVDGSKVVATGVQTQGSGTSETNTMKYTNSVQNKQESIVQIKVDSDAIQDYAGSVFHLESPSGTVVGTLTVNKDGVSNSLTVKSGSYKLVEVTTPNKDIHAVKPTTLNLEVGNNLVRLGKDSVNTYHKDSSSNQSNTDANNITDTITFTYNGQIIHTITESGQVGSKFTKGFELPEGYIISNITVNNKPYTGSGFPDTISKTPETINYTLVKATKSNVEKYGHLNQPSVINPLYKHYGISKSSSDKGDKTSEVKQALTHKELHDPYYSNENISHRDQTGVSNNTQALNTGVSNTGVSNTSNQGQVSQTSSLPHTGLTQGQVVEHNVTKGGLGILAAIASLLAIFGIKLIRE